jgi:hypothetical protein
VSFKKKKKVFFEQRAGILIEGGQKPELRFTLKF